MPRAIVSPFFGSRTSFHNSQLKATVAAALLAAPNMHTRLKSSFINTICHTSAGMFATCWLLGARISEKDLASSFLQLAVEKIDES